MIRLFFGTGSAEKQGAIRAAFEEALRATPGIEKEVRGEFGDPEELMAYLMNGNLFSERRFVILQNVSAKSEVATFVVENMDKIKGLSDIDIVFSENELDKRGVFYKAFTKGKLAQEFFANEMEITKKLDLPSVNQAETWALTNFLLRGEKDRYMSVIHRTEKICYGNEDEAFRLFGLLSTQLLQFMAMKLAGDKSTYEIAKELDMKSDYPLKQMASAGGYLSARDAVLLVKKASRLDKNIKTGKMTAWQAVKRLA